MRVGALSACAASAVVVASLVMPAVADPVSPPTLYVTASPHDQSRAFCSDSWPGTASQPLCDIQAAADIAVPGQTVLVDPDGAGLFVDEDVHITRSGTPGQPIVIKVAEPLSAPGDEVNVIVTGGVNGFVLDGVHDVTLEGFGVSGTSSSGIVASNSSDITIDGDFVDNDNRGVTDGIDISGSSTDVTISRSTLDANDDAVWIGPGVSGTDVAENNFRFGEGAVSVNGATNTDITNNSALYNMCPPSVFTVAGGSTGTSIENNVESAICATPVSLLTVAADSATSTHADYNIVSDNTDKGSYSWAGTSYATAAQLAAATGQGAHDLNVPPLLHAGALPGEGSPALDSADANAPGLLATDYYGHQREDDPLTANTGTGIGYVDRGAAELQDPLKLGVVQNTGKAPVGGTVVLTFNGTKGWAPVTGYTVDFGDGTPPVTTTSTTISHVYTTARDTPYPITATVTDSLGYSAASPNTGISIVPPAPLVPVMDVEPVLWSNNALSFSVNMWASTDSWDLRGYTCDFGDGSGNSNNCVYAYAKPGTYRITGTITDTGGNSATISRLVVAGTVPVAQPNPGSGKRCPTCY